MLRILTFKEVITLRKEIPKHFKKGSREYHQSMANVNKYLVENHAPYIDSGSVEKLRREAKVHQEAATRVRAIQDKFKKKKAPARKPAVDTKTVPVIVKINGKQYRLRITEAEIYAVESITRCEFCIPSIKHGNFLHLFIDALKEGQMQKITLKDFMTPLIVIGCKIGGSSISDILSVSIIDYQDSGVMATARDSQGNVIRMIFKLHGGLYKMSIIVRVNDVSTIVVVSAEQ